MAGNPALGGSNVLESYIESKFGCVEKYGTQKLDTMSPSDFEALQRMWEFSNGILMPVTIWL